MRFSQMFGTTLRDAPAGADTDAQRLAVRSGLVSSLAPGIHAYLPLGQQALRRFSEIVRAEWTAVGGQEVALPLVQPVDQWQRSGRQGALPLDTARFRDESSRELAAGMRREWAVMQLARSQINSHSQLPVLLFEEAHRISRRSQRRLGLLGSSAYHVVLGYSLHADADDSLAFYGRMSSTIENILRRCGLEPLRAEAAVGVQTTLEGRKAHSWVIPHQFGGEPFVSCQGCGYTAVLSAARMAAPIAEEGQDLPLEEVATPGAETIAALAEFLHVPQHRTLKVVFYSERGQVICVAIRGDRTVDEGKLAAVLGSGEFYASTEDELASVGTVGGYGSPAGLTGARVLADRTVLATRNLVAGANKAGYHLLNVNTPRDFQIDQVADLAKVEDGDPCPHCEGTMRVQAGVELARAEIMGSDLSQELDATFLDAQGRSQSPLLASYAVGLDRLLMAVIEAHQDEQGIIWPRSVAPYQVHLLGLNLNKPEIAEEVERLYGDLRSRGFSVLYDDRNASAGVKFNDADLIGLPLRLTLSSRSLRDGGVEVKWRGQSEREVRTLEDLPLVLRGFAPVDS